MDTQVRLTVETRELFADGMPFGDVGPYERLVGRVEFAVDPEAAAYRNVVDVQYAPRDATGRVTYATPWYMLKPCERDRGNRRLIYDVVNRGNKRLVQFFNDAVHSNTPKSMAHAGNGFLLRRGYTIVWCGWQGDLAPGDGRLGLDAPVASTADGSITGLVRAEFIANEPGILTVPLSGNAYTRSYAAATLETGAATLTRREYASDTRQPIASDAWRFASLDDRGTPQPSATDCYVPAGFRPGWIYELVYSARDPLVLGLGFTAVRDLISLFRYASHDTVGTPNPLWQDAPGIEQAYAWGRSQSGRFLRAFVHQGWNEDAQARRVFDGVWPHVTGAGRLALNYRFAQPDRYPRQREDHLYASDQFPFAYATTTDPWTGKTDAILQRPMTDPLVIHTQTSSEYWQRRGSLVHTDAFGQDLPAHPQARIYLFASSQHHAAPGAPPVQGPHCHLSNPLNTSPLLRALLDALDRWVTDGVSPPASRIPTRAAGTLVPAPVVQAQFPCIPGVRCPGVPNRLYVQEYGPEFGHGHITQEPPVEVRTQEYAVLVPTVDADGNEVAGIRTPHVAVPLATFTGWNPRAEGYGYPELMSIIGSYLPFARTVEERLVGGDTRPAVEERYHSLPAYVRRMAQVVAQLVQDRLLLDEDADRYIAEAMHERALIDGTTGR